MRRISEADFPDIVGHGTVVLHSGCAEPPWFAEQLARNALELKGANVVTLMPMGETPYASDEATSLLRVRTFLPGTGLRPALSAGRVEALRVPLSEIPKQFSSRAIVANVLALQVSPPDASGTVSIGVCVDYMRAVLEQRPVVVAQINPKMPRTCGESTLPVSAIDLFVESASDLREIPQAAPDEVDLAIAKNVAGLIEDGAVLQVGIGSLPDCVLGQLHHLKHLGLHSGIITDAAVPLIERGIIDNTLKTHMPGVSVTTMAGGTRRLYDFLDANPSVQFLRCDVTHDRKLLATISRLTAINSALQADLFGNVNAEAVSGRRISLPGGQPDFAAGASAAPGGMSIVAIRSAVKSTSSIVARFDAQTPVTSEAGCIDYLVTEYGIAKIRGIAPAQRARDIIHIAHPSARDALLASLASCA